MSHISFLPYSAQYKMNITHSPYKVKKDMKINCTSQHNYKYSNKFKQVVIVDFFLIQVRMAIWRGSDYLLAETVEKNTNTLSHDTNTSVSSVAKRHSFSVLIVLTKPSEKSTCKHTPRWSTHTTSSMCFTFMKL